MGEVDKATGAGGGGGLLFGLVNAVGVAIDGLAMARGVAVPLAAMRVDAFHAGFVGTILIGLAELLCGGKASLESLAMKDIRALYSFYNKFNSPARLLNSIGM